MSTRLFGLTLQLAAGHPRWKPSPRSLLPIVIWGSLLTSISASCDDAYVEGASGVVRAIRGHPAIRMVSEEVHISLPTGKVEAKFVFKNEGPANEVVIGFPEEGKDGKEETHIKGFRSAVDGQAVKVAKWIQYKPTEETDNEYQYWWVKRVRFEAGQTRTITNKYQGGWFHSTYGVDGLRYILRTGASWKGPIGTARIICDIAGLKEFYPIAFEPGGWKRKSHEVEWNFVNFKPKQDIFVEWFRGFMNVEVNGRYLGRSKDDPMPPWNPELGAPPQRLGRDLWISVRTAQNWLGAELDISRGRRSVRLKKNGHFIDLEVGSRTASTDRGVRSLGHPVHLFQDSIVAPLTPIVTALGGKCRFNSNGRFIVTLR